MKKTILLVFIISGMLAACKKNITVTPAASLVGNWQAFDTINGSLPNTIDFTIEKVNDSIVKVKGFPVAGMEFNIKSDIPADTTYIRVTGATKTAEPLSISKKSAVLFTYNFILYFSSVNENHKGRAVKL